MMGEMISKKCYIPVQNLIQEVKFLLNQVLTNDYGVQFPLDEILSSCLLYYDVCYRRLEGEDDEKQKSGLSINTD